MKLKWLKDKLGEKFYPIAHATGVVLADNKTLDSKLSEIDAEIGNKANKTEIPTELPANGGNADTINGHTVKSDVPENAVFTDTVYDDTEVQKRISDNGYGEVAGGKNLAKSYKSTGTAEQYLIAFLVDVNLKPSTTYTISFVGVSNYTGYPNEFLFTSANLFRCNGERQSITLTTKESLLEDQRVYPRWLIFKNSDSGIIPSFTDVQIEIGSEATSYEPYFPSNKMLAEENTQQSTEIMDIKMLGWSVPKECPIQNEVNGNQFVQKVGRIDLGNYNYGYSSTQGFYIRNFNSSEYGIADNNQNYLMGYTIYTNMNDLMQSDKGLLIYKTSFNIKDSAYTDPSAFKSAMQGKYLYYELATPITTTIDGNEIGETVSDLRGDMYFEKEISLAKAQLIKNGSYSDINIISSLFLFGANGKFGLSRGYISLSIPVSFSKKDEIYIKLPYKQYGYKKDDLLPHIYKTVFCTQGDFNGKIIGTCNLSYYSGSDDEGISLTIDINDNYSFTDDNISSVYVDLRF